MRLIFNYQDRPNRHSFDEIAVGVCYGIKNDVMRFIAELLQPLHMPNLENLKYFNTIVMELLRE